MRRLALVITLCAAGFAGSAAAQPNVLRVDAAFEIAKAADGRPQLNPALAHDGAGTYLVVWQQGQRYYQQQKADILAVRVDASGRVLDRTPIVVSRASGSQEQPDVAFANGAFLVVWQDLRSGKRWDVYGARITAEGQLMDAEGIAIGTDAESQAQPQVAAAPGGYIVVWQALVKGYYRIQGAFVSERAAVSPFTLTQGAAPLFGGDPALTRIKSGWVLAWKDEKAWTVSGDGIITRRFAALSGNPAKPTVGEIQRAPAIWLGGAGGRFLNGGDRALYVSTELAGRGQRVWTSTLLEGATAEPLKNPNAEPNIRMSSWDTSRMIPVATLGTAYEGLVAGDSACDSYVLVAAESQEAKRGTGILYGARLGRDGKRYDADGRPAALLEAKVPLANPVLRFGTATGLLVYEQRDGAGHSSLRGGVLHCGGR